MHKIDFIAEVSSNHNRDLGRMEEFIIASKEAGCSGVEFHIDLDGSGEEYKVRILLVTKSDI